MAIDEAHCVKLWGKDFRHAYQEPRFICILCPSVPIMALSATLPPSLEFLVSRYNVLRKQYSSVSQPLDHQNILYSVRKKQGLSPDLSPLVSCTNSAECPELVLKNCDFGLTKYVCCSIMLIFRKV